MCEALDRTQSGLSSRIAKQLFGGAFPVWSQAFAHRPARSVLPIDHATGRVYSGINVLLLWEKAQGLGYTTHRWLDQDGANQLGAELKQGQTPVRIVRWHIEIVEGDSRRSLVPYSVFHVSQFEGLDVDESEEDDTKGNLSAHVDHALYDSTTALSLVRRAMRHSSLKLYHGSLHPTYIPKGDMIWMPEGDNPVYRHDGTLESTPGDDETLHFSGGFASDLVRQLASASGHPARLARYDITRRRHHAHTCPAHNQEELIVELTAAFLCAHLGIRYRYRHHPRTSCWIEGFRADPKFLTRAAGEASRAMRYIVEGSTLQGTTHATPAKSPVFAVQAASAA